MNKAKVADMHNVDMISAIESRLAIVIDKSLEV